MGSHQPLRPKYHTHLRTRPALGPASTPESFMSASLTMQRRRANEILLTQRNKQTIVSYDDDIITAPVLLADCVTTGNGLNNGVHCGL